MGVAALAIHDRIRTPRCGPLIERWMAAATTRMDPSGALSHSANSITGSPLGGVRGSSLALMSRVLIDVDRTFAAQQYAVLRSNFVGFHALVPGVREYPVGIDGAHDIDSGPLVLGYSGPATVVGAAAARAHGDEALAQTLFGVVEMAGFAWQWKAERRYLFGLVPVGDAFIVWARATTPIVHDVESLISVPAWWRWPWHALSLLLLMLLSWPLHRRAKDGPKPRPA